MSQESGRGGGKCPGTRTPPLCPDPTPKLAVSSLRVTSRCTCDRRFHLCRLDTSVACDKVLPSWSRAPTKRQFPPSRRPLSLLLGKMLTRLGVVVKGCWNELLVNSVTSVAHGCRWACLPRVKSSHFEIIDARNFSPPTHTFLFVHTRGFFPLTGLWLHLCRVCISGCHVHRS